VASPAPEGASTKGLRVNGQDTGFPPVPGMVRLRLRPADAGPGPVLDGGWWPRSCDPVCELGLLIPFLDRWRDKVATLSLSVAGWDDHPARLTLDNRLIPLHWLGFYHDLLIATCADHRQVRLLVIPLDTSGPVADDAMTTALDPANHAPPPAILARAIAHRLSTSSAHP
jgi:Family of unknown function (DUF5994)